MGSQRSGRCLLIFVFLALPLSATTYYVDNCVTVGSDSNNGTSTSTPWLTINKVNTFKFSAGDSVMFQKTCLWHEKLNFPSSGSAGNSIILGAYGEGAAPIFDGADIQSTWTSEAISGSFIAYHSASSSYARDPLQVFQLDGSAVTRLTKTTDKTLLIPATWFYDSTNTRIYVRTTADDTPANHIMEVSARDAGVQAAPINYVTINGLAATRSQINGFVVNGTGGIFENNTSTYNYEYGFEGNASISSLFQNNTASYNGSTGIDFMGGGTNDYLVTQNTATYNCQLYLDGGVGSQNQGTCAGIRVGGTTGNGTLSYNISAYNPLSSPDSGFGFHVDTNSGGSSHITLVGNHAYGNYQDGFLLEGATEITLMYNVSYGNKGKATSSGIEVYNCPGPNLISNNTSYGNAIGIRSHGNGRGLNQTNNLFHNNISVNNSATNLAATFGGQNDGTDGSGNVYTYNALGTAATNFIQWGNTTFHSTYATWEAATGNCGTTGCSHSIQTTPTFVNASGNNFALASGSSAINAGTNLGASYSWGLNPASSWPSSVTLLPQSRNNAGWDIGAFVFVQDISPAPPTSLSAVVH